MNHGLVSAASKFGLKLTAFSKNEGSADMKKSTDLGVDELDCWLNTL